MIMPILNFIRQFYNDNYTRFYTTIAKGVVRLTYFHDSAKTCGLTRRFSRLREKVGGATSSFSRLREIVGASIHFFTTP